MGIITLLTDFGTADGYPGVMHGVILSIHPEAVVVHVCHEIPPQDIQAGAFVVSTVYRYFPPHTIHVGVVDPGVGSERRAIAVRTNHGTFVGPDNGLLSYIFARETITEMVQLTNERYWLHPVSDTFHGRDIFAPVAAHLARGVALTELGPPIRDPIVFAVPTAETDEHGTIHGVVLHVDRFGNLTTSIPNELVQGRQARVHIGGHIVQRVRRTYAEVAEGELLALPGSSGYLEVAVRGGNAATLLGIGRHSKVQVATVGS